MGSEYRMVRRMGVERAGLHRAVEGLEQRRRMIAWKQIQTIGVESSKVIKMKAWSVRQLSNKLLSSAGGASCTPPPAEGRPVRASSTHLRGTVNAAPDNCSAYKP